MNLFEGLYLASGLVFMALGVLLVVGRWRHLPAVALAFYVLSLGTIYAARSVWGVSGFAGPAQSIVGFVAAAALGTFAVSFPRPLAGRGWIDGAVAFAYGLVLILTLGWLSLQDASSAEAFRRALGVSGTGLVLMLISFHVIAVVSVAAWVLLPLRARRFEVGEGSSMRTLGHLAVAYLLVSPGGPFPGIVAAARGIAPVAQGVIVFSSAIAVLLLWLLSTMGPHRRAARNIILVLVVLTLALGAIHHIAGDLVVPLGRLLSALVLTYSVLTGHIEGLDVKVRWGISKSTVAAAFVAAFFLASEGAQIVFGQGNEWVGLLAAGALVFALAPLQRAAERLAARAVPLGDATLAHDAQRAPHAGPHTEDTYRKALRLALRDRRLTREEEIHLAEVAEAMGIGAGRAVALLREAEIETGVAS